MTEIKLARLKCLRCGYIWYPRSENSPKVCPNCKSPYWNTERRKRGKKMESENENWKGIIYMETKGFSKEHVEVVMEFLRIAIDSELSGMKAISSDVKRVMQDR